MTTSTPVRKPITYTPAQNFIPDAGQPVEIKPGLSWLRMPLPFELEHINLWLIEGAGGWTIIDTGFNAPETTGHWDNLFESRFKAKQVEDIFITHFHPDHFGLAGWLSERSGVTVQMTEPEYNLARLLTDAENSEALADAYRPYYFEAGLDDALLEDMLNRRSAYRRAVYKPPRNIQIVRPGETVILGGRAFEIVGGYGHSPEHACLYSAEQRLLISGDMILPDISPNISLYPGSSADPVGDYLHTLDIIEAKIPDDTVILPSHGVPFTGLHKRIAELRQHHARRFEKLHAVMASGPQTAHQIMTGLFAHRVLKTHDIFFALGETLAHLAREMKTGKVMKTFKDGRAVYLA